MAEWVVSRPIFEFCDREKGYEVGGSRREPWWRKNASRKQMSDTLKDILETARELR